MTSPRWTPIPVLPAVTLPDTLAFWEGLGFAVTYNQKAPYPYGVVEREGAALHFAYVEGVTPQTNSSGCLIFVDDAEAVHADFAARFKARLGKVPSSGLPRLSRWRPGATRFTVTDVAGNWVIVIARGEKDQKDWEKAEDASQGPLRLAMAKAVRYRDYKQDPLLAIRTLDAALKKAEEAGDEALEEARALRASIAAEQVDDG